MLPSVRMYRRKDAFYQRAKIAGYRSRAAYKLIELNQRLRLIQRGDRVLDLGAWPGGWLQVAAEAVGPRGRVVGVDIKAIEPLPQPWVRILFGSAADENVRGRIADALGGVADVILSDMAPKVTGVRDRDEVNANELVLLAASIAREFLRPGGKLLVKLYAGSAMREALSELSEVFTEVRTTRPKATRKESSELYALASGLRPQHS